VQVSSPVGTRPAFCAGSCPAARATVRSFSRILAGQAPLTFLTPAGSVEDPAPPGTARQGRCAAWAGVLVLFQGCSELLGSAEAVPHSARSGLSRMITRSSAARSRSCSAG
jgi:hypothetical protein